MVLLLLPITLVYSIGFIVCIGVCVCVYIYSYSNSKTNSFPSGISKVLSYLNLTRTPYLLKDLVELHVCYTPTTSEHLEHAKHSADH